MGSFGTKKQKMWTVENCLAPWLLHGFFGLPGFLGWFLGYFWSIKGSGYNVRENRFRAFQSFSYVYETVQWVSIFGPEKKLYGSKPKKLAATRLNSVGQSAICNFGFLSIFDISLDVSSRKSVYIRDGRVKIRQSVLKIYPHMPWKF